MKNKNKYQILPLAIGLILLSVSYALASGGVGREASSQASSINDEPLSPSLESSAEELDLDLCAREEISCLGIGKSAAVKHGGEPSYPAGLPVSGYKREITMYTSRVQETDSTPCISADGTNICKVDYNVCASNAYPFGTKLRIQGLGDCIVKDRMNRRYKNRIDWYAGMDLQRALKFGRQNLNVEIL